MKTDQNDKPKSTYLGGLFLRKKFRFVKKKDVAWQKSVVCDIAVVSTHRWVSREKRPQ